MKMKVLLFCLLSIMAFAASAQRYQPALLYGKEENRLKVKRNLGIPDSLYDIPEDQKGFPHIARFEDVTYYWSPAAQDWVSDATSSGLNNYPISLGFNTSNGIFSVTRNGLPDITVGIDGRYLTIADAGAYYYDKIVADGRFAPLVHPHIPSDITGLSPFVRSLFHGGVGINYDAETGTFSYSGVTEELDPTIDTIIKNIPVGADVTTNKYLNWDGSVGQYIRKQINYSDIAGTPPAATNIYNSDGTVTGTRAINLNGNLLYFSQSGGVANYNVMFDPDGFSIASSYFWGGFNRISVGNTETKIQSDNGSVFHGISVMRDSIRFRADGNLFLRYEKLPNKTIAGGDSAMILDAAGRAYKAPYFSGLGVNMVTNANLRQSVGTSVIGRSSGSTGDVDDIIATVNGQYLIRRGGALVWAVPLYNEIGVSAGMSNQVFFANPASTNFSSDTDFTYDSNTDILGAPILKLKESSAPSTPPTGYAYMYPKSDGIMYYKNDAGIETPWSSSSFTNPMTSLNDIIVGGTGGAPARLALGGANTVLGNNGGNIGWVTGTPWNGTYASSSVASSTGITLSTTTFLNVFNGSSSATWTLPDRTLAANKSIHISNSGSANLTIQRGGTDQIWDNGASTSIVVIPGQSVQLTSINGYWTTLFTGLSSSNVQTIVNNMGLGYETKGQLMAIDGGEGIPDTLVYHVPIAQIPVGAGDSTVSSDSLRFTKGQGNFQIAGSAPSVTLAKGDPNNESTSQGGFNFVGSRVNFTHDIFVPGTITQQYQAPSGELWPAYFDENGTIVPDFEVSTLIKRPELSDSMAVLRDSLQVLKDSLNSLKEIVLAGGTGGGSVSIPYSYNLVEDFLTGWTGVKLNTAGTSSSAVNPINGEPGRARMTAASTAAPTNSAAYTTDNGFNFALDTNYTYRLKVEDFKLLALSTATTTYFTQIGFQDKFTTTTTEPSDDAVCFRYTHGENGGKWQAYIRSAAGTASVTDLGITVDTNPHTYEVKVKNALAWFYYDGALIATITTGIPGTGQYLGVGIHTTKTVDSGTNTVSADLGAIKIGYQIEN